MRFGQVLLATGQHITVAAALLSILMNDHATVSLPLLAQCARLLQAGELDVVSEGKLKSRIQS